MDCGTKHKGGPAEAMPSKAKEPKITYPSFTLNDEKATAFLKETEAEVGDFLTSSTKLEVTGMRDDEYGKSVTLSVVALNDLAEGEADAEAEEGEADEKDEKPAKVNKAVRRMMKEA